MDNNSIWAVIITLITTLGGTTAFRYYEKRAIKKERDDDFIKHDCKDRISKLEALLEKSSQEKDEMRKQILDLVAEVAALRTEIKYLTDKRIGSI
jgi:septal ring factor EnvC (AmiA/AmiB activator)